MPLPERRAAAQARLPGTAPCGWRGEGGRQGVLHQHPNRGIELLLLGIWILDIGKRSPFIAYFCFQAVFSSERASGC